MDSTWADPVDFSLSEPHPDVPNAAWTWFTDERAVVDTDVGAAGPRILVGTVTSRTSGNGGDVDVLWYDSGTGESGHARLHARFEQDDHNGPALFVRPDGRYLAVYAKHNTDPYTRWRVSTDPHDPAEWEPERRLDNGAGTTYATVYHLSGDDGGIGRTYCFTRSRNWDPNVLTSIDQGTTWSPDGRLLGRGGSADRPYVRYWGDGECIHFAATETHPHDHENGLYHGSLRDGTLTDSTGRVLNDDVLNGDGVPPAPSDLTTVFESGTAFDGTRMTRAWALDVASDPSGDPVVLFQARARDDPGDHRFFYARYDGSSWQVAHVAKAGPQLYEREFDYTGLAAIDPDDPRRIVISTSVDPRDGGGRDHHELFAGVTTNGGETWQWTPITPGATTDNLRPLIPAWNSDRTALIWMRGRYETYTSWETQAVGAVDPPGLRR